MRTMKKMVGVGVVIMGLLFLFGCTALSVNPLDLAPANKYTGQTDTNTLITSNGTSTGTGGTTPTKISLTAAEVAKHATETDCWMILNGNVYDLSQYVNHPGGYIYVSYCGTDGTSGYNTKGGRGRGHSSFADAILSSYYVGKVGQDVTVTDTNTPAKQTTTTNPSQQGRFPSNPYYWDD